MQDSNNNAHAVEATIVHNGHDDPSPLAPVLGAFNENMRWARIASVFEKVLIHSATEETKRQHSQDRRDESIAKTQSDERKEIARINNNFELSKIAVSRMSELANGALCSGDNKALESTLDAMVRVVKENVSAQ